MTGQDECIVCPVGCSTCKFDFTVSAIKCLTCLNTVEYELINPGKCQTKTGSLCSST